MKTQSHDSRQRSVQPSAEDLPPPVRSCVGCGIKQSQRVMLRIAAHEGVEPVVDTGYSAPGRGAYLCRKSTCVDSAFKRHALERTLKLKQSISATLKDTIRQIVEQGS